MTDFSSDPAAGVFGFFLIMTYFAVPFFMTYKLCMERNRNVGKGLFIVGVGTFFFGMNWIAMILLWLGLRKRDSSGRLM